MRGHFVAQTLPLRVEVVYVLFPLSAEQEVALLLPRLLVDGALRRSCE